MIIRQFWLCLMLSLYFMMQSIQSEPAYKGIVLPDVHQHNQALCAQIVKKFCQTHFEAYSPQQLAHALNSHIDVLAQQLMDQGLDLKAYSYDKCDDAPYLKFARIPLWEGAHDIEPPIPLTLFIYVWPPEHIAKQIAIDYPTLPGDPRPNYYATHIHGHPLICALVVLKGNLYQENYLAVSGYPFNVAEKQDEEVIPSGISTVDNNITPFIHRILCRDAGREPSISLHGYGAPTAQEVLNIFNTTRDRYFYLYVLQDGKLIYQNR